VIGSDLYGGRSSLPLAPVCAPGPSPGLASERRRKRPLQL